MAVSILVGGIGVGRSDVFWGRVREGLRRVREERRLTQRDVADRLGVPYETYRSWERSAAEMRLEKLKEVADAMGMSLSELLHAIGVADDPLLPGSAVERELVTLFGPEEAATVQRLLPALARMPHHSRQMALRLIRATVMGDEAAN